MSRDYCGWCLLWDGGDGIVMVPRLGLAAENQCSPTDRRGVYFLGDFVEVRQMASVTKRTKDGRNGWRIRFYLQKRRRELYLAGVSKKVAEAVGRHCDELAGAKGANTPPATESIAWANGTDGRLRESLVAWGLADPINPRLATDEGRLLGCLLSSYIDGRTDTKPVTPTNYRQTRRLLVEYFGERHPCDPSRRRMRPDGEDGCWPSR